MVADEWFHTSVSELMCLQVSFGNERKVTFNAFERSFTSVSSNVCLKITSLRELFKAGVVGADEDSV